jgi:beta-glucuronidase
MAAGRRDNGQEAPTRLILVFAAGALLALGGAPAGAASPAETPSEKALYEDGPNGRYLLGGRWLYRADPGDTGIADGFQRERTTRRWRPVRVPHAFNARDYSQRSLDGSVGWYRKDFRAPEVDRGFRWAVRFESVSYRARVWLNGTALGAHEGAYLPFELAARGLTRRGTNRLVVRVDSRRADTDVPPRLALWWNWGGMLREVYLRRVGPLDIESAQVIPRLQNRNRRARLTVTVRVRNGTAEKRGGLRGLVLDPKQRHAAEVPFPQTPVAAFSSRTYEATVRLSRPKLWWPERPRLYRLRLEVGPPGQPDQTYSTHLGVRAFTKDPSGQALLNGRPIQLRGAGMHEDSLRRGAALTPSQRAASLRYLKQLGANFTRAHYPLHPRTLELCDREGIVVWDQIPYYQLSPSALAKEGVRRKGLAQLREMILRDRNHASVIAYSIGNELGAPGAGLENYIRRAARLARALDPSRLVALDIGLPAGRHPVYDELDALGLNEYFGWYYSMVEALGPNLDALKRAYPAVALIVTEFGAEANRHGALGEKGTYQFQTAFLRSHLDVIARRPYISGALIWALRDFAVKPGYDGGNPSPSPPFHKKGLVGLRGEIKPAFHEVAALYRRTRATRPR